MQYQLNKYPSLTKSYKKCYPFKIGTTSFIYPDLYVPNVKMLGPFVDEIELLLFESAPVASLLPKAVITDLMHLSQDLQVTYNIHLPTDISISDPAPALQDKAVDTLVRILERMAPLAPSSHTLHVPYPSQVTGPPVTPCMYRTQARSLTIIIFESGRMSFTEIWRKLF